LSDLSSSSQRRNPSILSLYHTRTGRRTVVVLGLFSGTIVGIEGAIALSIAHGNRGRSPKWRFSEKNRYGISKGLGYHRIQGTLIENSFV